MIGKKKINASTGDTFDAEVIETPVVSAYTEAEMQETLISPAAGKIIPIAAVNDQAFASKSMGDGFAIEPTDGTIYAPYSGEVTVAFPTGHAYGIKSASGKEVLIHVGMDTVELNGKGFQMRVHQGDHVKQGDVLAVADLDYIRSQGKSTIIPVIFTDGTPVSLLKENQTVKAKETGIIKQ
jgi:glucose-specific phosphotransferase system IIA component